MAYKKVPRGNKKVMVFKAFKNEDKRAPRAYSHCLCGRGTLVMTSLFAELVP